MPNEIKTNKGAIVKEINGVKYFKLVSKYPGDYTKNCSLLGSEMDENFFFLRSYDIESAEFNDNNELVLTRVDGDTIIAQLPDLPEILFKKMTFEFDKDRGVLIVTYPDGTQEELDGFFVAGEQIKVATDYTIRGDGRIFNPLRISEVEKTGTYAPAKYYLDRTDGTPMPEGDKHGKGFRIVTKEKYAPFGLLYTYDGVKKIKEELQKISSPWRIPTREDWADLLNAAEYCEEDRNHDTFEINEWTGKYAGGRAKSHSFKEMSGGEPMSYDNLPTTGSDATFHVIPIGYGEGSRGVLIEDWDDDIEGLTKIASFWTDTPTGSKFKSENPNIFTRTFSYDTTKALQESSKPSSRLSLRLVKDYTYDSMDVNEYEYILGDAVPTVLISNPETEYSQVWTSINIGLSNPEFSGVSSSEWNTLSGEDREIKEVFYINEWNGIEWVKKQIRPGDSVVILDYDDDPSTSGDTYHEWRVYEYEDGTSELIDTAVALKEEFQKEIDEINEKIDELSGVTEELVETVDSITIEEITPTDETILKSYALLINETQKGATIDIPKDKNIHDISTGWSGSTINEETGEYTYEPETGDTEVLRIVYQKSNGKFVLVEINIDDFIHENEFKDGLEVKNHEVRVKIDENSDPYLTVSLDGILLSGISSTFEDLEQKIDDEIERAKTVENELSGNIITLTENLEELSASTMENIERLDGQDIANEGNIASVTEGITLKRKNNEEIKIEIDTNFGLLPDYD